MVEKLSPHQVDTLAAAARLPLPAGRAQEISGAVQSLLHDCDRLEEVDVTDCEAPVVVLPS